MYLTAMLSSSTHLIHGRRCVAPFTARPTLRTSRHATRAASTEPDTTHETIATTSEVAAPPKAVAQPKAKDARQEMINELLDPSAFGTRGEGWVAAQFAGFALLLLPPAALTSTIDSLATLTALVGVGFFAYSMLDLGQYITPLVTPRKEHELVTSGIYRFARHPMYGGVLMMALGASVVTHSEARLAATALLWWVFENKVAMEEGALSERYPEYAEYKAKVKKFIPFIY